ncbi:anthranilate synthase [Vibrio neptunius]|uniref:salicylate synthase n=1 Tax=Vibrio neptunius TaxID=170651 RepID=UPI0005F9BDA5|nr:salicylate synthase [Vibrio neptunius]KJY91897.1 anthranilate synthase [Vibrio neptunius]
MAKPSITQYHNHIIPHQCDPLAIATELSMAEFCDDYVVYEHNQEWSIGINKLAELTVDTQGKITDFSGHVHQPEHDLICDTIYQATQTLPWEGWRVFGRVDFEFSHFAHHLAQKETNRTLLELFVAQHDIRISNHQLAVRTTDDSVLPEIHQAIARASSLVQPEPMAPLTQADILDHHKIQHDYQTIVASAVREIVADDYKKVILSRSATLPAAIDIRRSFVSGRRNNTPARSFMLKLGELEAFGFSPETVLEVDHLGHLSTQPLAGTRFLPTDPEEAQRLKRELTTDPKEIAEHATSVKLAVEELEQVCDRSTVNVAEFMDVSERGTVQHLASRVTGQLTQGKSAWHAFKVLFPAITASGIPKREAIDAIARFEPTSRGLYSGSVLIADQDGFFDAALVLRAAYKRHSVSMLQAGAGVISLSTPAREWEETCEKMACVLDHLVFEAPAEDQPSSTTQHKEEVKI